MSWLNELLQNDPDPTETREWVESLKAVIDADGPERAHQLLTGMVELTRRAGAHLPFAPTTEYINTIPSHLEPRMSGDQHMEWRIRSIIRWNAMAMVVRANRKPGGQRLCLSGGRQPAQRLFRHRQIRGLSRFCPFGARR